MGKEEVKLYLFAEKILYIENSKDSKQKAAQINTQI